MGVLLVRAVGYAPLVISELDVSVHVAVSSAGRIALFAQHVTCALGAGVASQEALVMYQ